MNKHLGPIALAATLVGLVGGGAFAASQAFAPVEKPAQKVELVQPAAQTVTPSPTTATVKPVAKKPAPKPVVRKSVSSKPKATTNVAPVQRQAVVSEPSADPTPAKPAPFGTNPANGAPNPPPVAPGQQPPPPPSK